MRIGSKNIEKELRQVVREWLQTKKGWETNVRASLDFNWGDLIMELPLELPNIKLGGTAEDLMSISAVASIAVDQDELLAPDSVAVILMQSDGTAFGTGTVDFQTGVIDSVTSDQVMPKFDEPILVRPEGSTEVGLIAHWDSKRLCYFLDT